MKKKTDPYILSKMGKQTCTPKSAKNKNPYKIPNFSLYNIEKQMVPCKRTAEVV